MAETSPKMVKCPWRSKAAARPVEITATRCELSKSHQEFWTKCQRSGCEVLDRHPEDHIIKSDEMVAPETQAPQLAQIRKLTPDGYAKPIQITNFERCRFVEDKTPEELGGCRGCANASSCNGPEPPAGGGAGQPFCAQPAALPAPETGGRSVIETLLEQEPETLEAIRELARVEGEEPDRMAAICLRDYIEELLSA